MICQKHHGIIEGIQNTTVIAVVWKLAIVYVSLMITAPEFGVVDVREVGLPLNVVRATNVLNNEMHANLAKSLIL